MSKNNSIDVEIRASGYENVYFDCPKCKKENIINRIDDIGNDMPISRLDGIVCQNNKCRQIISILGDTVNDGKFRWFLDELYIFKARKEYRAYILSLCQGLEAFFYRAIINKKFDRNPAYFDRNGRINLLKYNQAVKIYNKKIFPYTFMRMRDEFMTTYNEEIHKYKPRKNFLRKDLCLVSFKELENNDISVMRNQVVHKYAFRPTLKDIEKFDKLIKSIYWVSSYLDIQDPILISRSDQNKS